MSNCVDAEGAYIVTGSGGREAPTIFFVDMGEHAFPLRDVAKGLKANVVAVKIRDWDNSLTPWPAPGLYEGDADFGGHAASTLQELVEKAIPKIEERFDLNPSKRAICGYSLGGLFSLYAFLSSDFLAACGALSPSVWYEGWMPYVSEKTDSLEGRFVFLSIGKKEKRAMPAILHSVEDNVVGTARLLGKLGCTTDVSIGPGNHMQHIPERIAFGLESLDGFLSSDNREAQPNT